MVEAVTFFVPGHPATAGSKKAFPYRKATGGLGVRVTHDNPRTTSWMSVVRHFAHEAMNERPPMQGPVQMSLVFLMPRPKGHYRTGKNSHLLRDDAPRAPATKPDLTKLVRCAEDALRGVVWVDDSQVVSHVNSKHYAETSDSIGVSVHVSQVAQMSWVTPDKDSPGGVVVGVQQGTEGLRLAEWANKGET